MAYARLTRQIRSSLLVAAILSYSTAALCESISRPPTYDDLPPTIDVEITRTRFHIPHIKANDFRSLGFGVGYAYAEDNVCLLAETLLTVRGERSKYFGPDAVSAGSGVSNIDSDTFYRAYLNRETIDPIYAGISNDARDLIRGYADGYNRYIRVTSPTALPVACRGSEWVTSASEADIHRLMADKMILASVGGMIPLVVRASPPSDSAKPIPHMDRQKEEVPGSNGYAIGKDLSNDQSGILLANPHFPWEGSNRFYEMHLTVPGKLDVMGATILPFPMVVIGFNRDVAWTHTVSTGQRSTLYELDLVPGNPFRYVYDGQEEPIVERRVTVDARFPDGSHRRLDRSIYMTRFGPIVMNPERGLAWSKTHAYAVRDAMLPNARALDQWLNLSQAKDVKTVAQSLTAIHGTPWVNTIAADRAGNTLYADLSIVPNVPDEMLKRCRPRTVDQAGSAQTGEVVLDGSRSQCSWVNSPGTRQDGVLPASSMPLVMRTDYVFNSNDSFWLANPDQPLTGYPAVVGEVGVEQGFRTRMGYKQLRELIEQKKGKITADDLRAMIMSDRNFAAELILDSVLEICGTANVQEVSPLSGVCTTLRAWDRRDDATSRGAALFREIWRQLNQGADLWVQPFDPVDPLRTPTGLAVERTPVREAVLAAIARVDAQFDALGIPLDASLGFLQTRPSAVGPIPLNGGLGDAGVLNLMHVGPLQRVGYANRTIGGSSYMQAVTWDSNGPVVHALLAYGQSSDPASPYFTDQTLLFLIKEWPRRPFSADEIAQQRESYLRLKQ